jgi:hypothetical protein
MLTLSTVNKGDLARDPKFAETGKPSYESQITFYQTSFLRKVDMYDCA